MTWRTWC